MNWNRHVLAFAILIAPCALLAQGVVSTVAGNGIADSTGDGGPATSAAIEPLGVVVDSAGNIYIADLGRSLIRKVDTHGIITTVAGFPGEQAPKLGDGGPATKASIYIAGNKAGLAVDATGNLYIADFGHHRIRKVDTSGMITTVAGNGQHGFSGDGGPATQTSLYNPTGVAVDGAGNLYIADNLNFRVRKVDPKGIITTVAGNGTFASESGDGGPAIDAAIDDPFGVAVDAAGNLYIADQGGPTVRKVDTKGIITTVAGTPLNIGFSGDGGPAISAVMADPYSVALDSAGNLYIADYNNGRVREVDATGTITTFAGRGVGPINQPDDGVPPTQANLQPADLAFDGAGNLYIADLLNNRIRKITLPRPAPTVNALGVVNNASFVAGSNPISPGAIAPVFGSHLDNGTNVLFSSFGTDGKLVTTLAGASVKINGEAAPIFYSTPGQLGIQIPTDVAGVNATIEVTVGGQTSTAQNVPIAPVSPGLFSTDQSGRGQGAILIANTNTLVAPTGSIPGRDSRPATPGEFITIFCTGLGALTPPLATGEKGTNNTTVDMPTVTIDGNPALLEFSGIAPGFVGLDQVNVQVPAGTRAADDIPVVLTIGGKQSNTVTIAVSIS